MWRELFGVDRDRPRRRVRRPRWHLAAVRPDGVSRSSSGTAVLVNVHRAGGSRGHGAPDRPADPGLPRSAAQGGSPDRPIADGDDTRSSTPTSTWPWAPVADNPAPRHGTCCSPAPPASSAPSCCAELLRATSGRIYCLVRAADERGRSARLREAARIRAAGPDPDRVPVGAGRPRDIEPPAPRVPGGELASPRRTCRALRGAGRVHRAVPGRSGATTCCRIAGLLRWMRASGIADLCFVSTVAATAPAARRRPASRRPGSSRSTRSRAATGSASGWASGCPSGPTSRRHAGPGLPARFHPGVERDRRLQRQGPDVAVLAGGLAVGAHPLDDRAHASGPGRRGGTGDRRAGRAAGSVGRVYHLVDSSWFACAGSSSCWPRRACRPTGAVEQWQGWSPRAALSRGIPMLSTIGALRAGGQRARTRPAMQATRLAALARAGPGLEPATGPARLLRKRTRVPGPTNDAQFRPHADRLVEASHR